MTVATVNRVMGTHYTLDTLWELPSELIEACISLDNIGRST